MNKIIRPFYRALGYYPATIAGHNYKLDPYHIKFWRKASRGEWEPNTYTILNKLLASDSVYCDIGAWIGPTVLHAAKICKQVICFEPDPNAYRYLSWNIALNDLDNVSSYSIALANSLAINTMASFGHTLGDSTSSLIASKAGQTVDVLQMPWEYFLQASNHETIDLLKIDIEGGEFALLPALKDYIQEKKTTLYLSTHAAYLDPEKRRESMQSIVNILSVYKTCLNDEMQEIDINDLTSDKTVNGFNSYIFMD